MRVEVVTCDQCGARCDKTSVQVRVVSRTRRDLCPLCASDLIRWLGGMGEVAENRRVLTVAGLESALGSNLVRMKLNELHEKWGYGAGPDELRDGLLDVINLAARRV